MIDPDLAVFARIFEAGSLSAAGRALGISPPMVSRRLTRLETRLGVTLVRRTTRRLELTAQGALFYQDVVAILAAIQDAEARLAGTRTPAGPLRLSAPTSFGRLHIAPTLDRFLDRYPDVQVELDLSDNFVDLLGERIDLALRITATVPAGLHAERLATSRRILCAAPGYLARYGAPAEITDLSAHKLLAAARQLPWRLLAGGREAVVNGASAVRTNSSEVVRELSIAGVGIALRSLWDVGADLAAGRLVRVLPAVEGSLDVGIYAIRPRAAILPLAVEAFTAHLRSLLQPAPPWEVTAG